MASPKPKPKKRDPSCPADYMDMWMCECCSHMFEGASPPDHCDMCDHGYFDNVCDVMSEADC